MRGAGLQDSALWFTWILFECNLPQIDLITYHTLLPQ